jgi:hypothetical protein
MVRAAAFAALLATLALAAPAAAQSGCRADRLGNTICRDLPEPPATRPRRTIPVAPEAELAPTFIPSTRTDAFGTTRPSPRCLAPSPRFGTPPRPAAPSRACTTDAFGHTRCR